MRSTPLSARSPAVVLALCILAAFTGRADAQETVNHLYDKFQFNVSGAAVVLGSDVQINGSNGNIGTSFTFGDLGIAKSAFSPAAGLAWRPGRRHQLEGAYVHVDRSGEKVLADTISFADTSFAAGLNIKSSFAAPTAFLAYRFAFMAKEKTQLGVQVGLGALFFTFGIDALAGTSGASGSHDVSYSASKSLVGPTASLGLFGAFRAGDHWYFGLDGGAIGVRVSNVSATTWAGAASVRYFFSNHWGVGGGWTFSGIKISSSGNEDNWLNLSGSIKYTYQVFRLGVVYALP